MLLNSGWVDKDPDKAMRRLTAYFDRSIRVCIAQTFDTVRMDDKSKAIVLIDDKHPPAHEGDRMQSMLRCCELPACVIMVDASSDEHCLRPVILLQRPRYVDGAAATIEWICDLLTRHSLPL